MTGGNDGASAIRPGVPTETDPVRKEALMAWFENVSVIKKLYGLRLDTGEPVEHQPGDAFYGNLVESSAPSSSLALALLHYAAQD